MSVKPKKLSKLGRVIITTICVFVIGIGLGAAYLWNQYSKLLQTPLEPETIHSNELEQGLLSLMGKSTQLAIFGIDNRENGHYGNGNSDTIMIVHMDHERKEVKIVSVYRDTYLKIDEGYYGKANAAYAHNGAAGGISMLNTNLDLQMNRYVTVDWYAVAKAINLLGGVEIEISEAEKEKINEYIPEVEKVTGIQTHSVEQSGKIHLDGVQVMAYMRIRKLAGDDYKRTERQRYVIQTVFNEVKQSDWRTLNQVLDQVLPTIETNLTLSEIVELGMNMGQYQIVGTVGFPFTRTTKVVSGKGDCVIPVTLEKNVEALQEYLFSTADSVLSEEVMTISTQIVKQTGVDT